MTRAGIAYSITKYLQKIRETKSEWKSITLSPHSFRHSRATHLLEAGVPMYCIRDFLGHSSIQTTEIYARVNDEFVKKVLEKAHGYDALPKSDRVWKAKPNLLHWLNNFNC